MNLQQLQYILAVDTHRHFAKAAEACFVTQPTLSMMIRKLEEELGVTIFDRSRHPVMPTRIGARIIDQARAAVRSVNRVKELVEEEREAFHGTYKIGVIPTIAPYFLPYFLPAFVAGYPQVQLVVAEQVTSRVISDLLAGLTDAAILATPLAEPALEEHPLYYERFCAYVSPKEKAFRKKFISIEDIRADRLWLLEEGHCFRSQIIQYCELRQHNPQDMNESFIYEAGSIETLIRLVDQYDGMTIIPEMAAAYILPQQSAQLKPFTEPVPLREISLVTRQDFMRHRLVSAFREVALACLPDNIAREKPGENVIGISLD